MGEEEPWTNLRTLSVKQCECGSSISLIVTITLAKRMVFGAAAEVYLFDFQLIIGALDYECAWTLNGFVLDMLLIEAYSM